jgi:hypothetical protein
MNIFAVLFIVAMSFSVESSNNTMCFTSDYKLQRKDYKSSHSVSKDRKVYSDFGISMTTTMGQIDALEICAFFNPYRSYCHPEASGQELDHETYRWKIYQLAKLEIVELYANQVIVYSADQQIIFDDIENKYAALDRQYNVATRFGTNPNKESEWRMRIDSMYQVKKHYEDSVVYCR